MTRGGAMEHNESSQGDFESTLKKHAVELVESLEKGRFGDAEPASISAGHADVR